MRDPAFLAEELTRRFQAKGRVAVAFSGGVDSALLAKIGALALGEGSLAVIVDSESYAAEEKESAVAFAKAMGVPHEVVWHSELADANYVANPVNRCYFCRQGLGEVMTRIARERGFDAVAVGTNQDDLADYRPGTQAIVERGLWQPFVELAVTKEEVRAVAKHLALPVWDKPSMACLSSRIPYGEPVSLEKLTRVGRAESLLRAKGFRQVRVRTFEGNRARIEVEPHEIARLAAAQDEVARELAVLGYVAVEIDPKGYRTGALNEGIVRLNAR